jgi:hypothetical protein
MSPCPYCGINPARRWIGHYEGRPQYVWACHCLDAEAFAFINAMIAEGIKARYGGARDGRPGRTEG